MADGTNLIGNSRSLDDLRLCLRRRSFPALVYGLRGVGKFTACRLLVGENSKVIDCATDISEVKDVFPVDHSFLVILDNFSDASQAAQDFFLKKLEESNNDFIVISHDNGSITDAILSRFRAKIPFRPLNISGLMREGFSESVSNLSGGSFSVALFLNNFPAYVNLYEQLSQGMKPLDIPDVKDDIYRHESKQVMTNIMTLLHRQKVFPGLLFSSRLSKTKSINMDLHIKTSVSWI
jgi:hypothetical protein